MYPLSGGTINDIDLMVSHNEAYLENLCENENIASHDNEVEDEASPLNQPSQFEAPILPSPKGVKDVTVMMNLTCPWWLSR